MLNMKSGINAVVKWRKKQVHFEEPPQRDLQLTETILYKQKRFTQNKNVISFNTYNKFISFKSSHDRWF